MTSQGKKILDEALQLSPDNRESLAAQLFDSLESTDPNAEAAWETEIAQRIEEIDQGRAALISWREARETIFGDADDSPSSIACDLELHSFLPPGAKS